MEFKYEKKFENNENWYTVGVVKGLVGEEEVYAVEIMDPAGRELCERSEWKPGSVAVAVFGITEDEFNMFSENIKAFDALVERLKKDIPKDRLFAERNCVRKSDRQETIDENNEFKLYIAGKVKKAAPNLNISPKDIISGILAADKICVAYSTVTDRPALNVVNDNANLIMTLDENVMDSFVENQKNVYKKIFLGDAINGENQASVFTYFYKLGINMAGFLLPDKRVVNIPLEAIINSDEYVAKKPGEEFCNPELDRHITCLLQLLRTVQISDENKEAMDKNTRFLDIKIMEAALNAKYLISQKAVKKENGQIEFSLSVVEQKETGERLVPVATLEEEYVANAEGFEKIEVTYDHLLDVVEKSKLDGFVINCKSKCGYKFTKQKLEQVENFRKWRDEQIKKAQEQNKAE